MTLPQSFFARPAPVVARALLGAVLCRRFESGPHEGTIVRAAIVETEAYTGPEDQASHARNGRRTASNEPMWMSPGTAYVYFTYGMHFCFNVSCYRAGHPAAVLLRAARILEGHDAVRATRQLGRSSTSKPLTDAALLRGPACLCKGLGIDRKRSGSDVLNPVNGLWFEAGKTPRSSAISKGPRIGLGKAAADKNTGSIDWVSQPLRFWLDCEACVSGPSSRHQG